MSVEKPRAQAVYPPSIELQRKLDWPDFHPEDYCHRCGQRNVRSWSTDDATFAEVAESHEIICPQCMSEAWEKKHGLTTWRIVPENPKDGSTP